jgi:hypothetical protein
MGLSRCRDHEFVRTTQDVQWRLSPFVDVDASNGDERIQIFVGSGSTKVGDFLAGLPGFDGTSLGVPVGPSGNVNDLPPKLASGSWLLRAAEDVRPLGAEIANVLISRVEPFYAQFASLDDYAGMAERSEHPFVRSLSPYATAAIYWLTGRRELALKEIERIYEAAEAQYRKSPRSLDRERFQVATKVKAHLHDLA